MALSDEDKARIQAEEEYRAEARAKLETSSTSNSVSAGQGHRTGVMTPASGPAKIGAVFLLALVGFVVYLVILGSNAPTTNTSADAVTGCQVMVRDRLKAPATARFSDSRAGGALDELGGSNIVWRGYVDAENSFGANLRTPFVCTVMDEQVRVVFGP